MGMLVIGINYKPGNNMKIVKIRYNVYKKNIEGKKERKQDKHRNKIYRI